MGYDMRWSQRGDGDYFRLNIFGMSRYRDLMEKFGMAFTDDPCPDFPDAADYGITYDDMFAVQYPEDYPGHQMSDDRREAARKMLAATQAVLDYHGQSDTPGIPLHKFSSNDGWHVLPAECEAAVRAWQSAADSDPGALQAVADSDGDSGRWLQWIAYLSAAARHGGFEVR